MYSKVWYFIVGQRNKVQEMGTLYRKGEVPMYQSDEPGQSIGLQGGTGLPVFVFPSPNFLKRQV